MEEQKHHEDEIDLTDIFRVLWKRKNLILIGTIIITLLAMAFLFIKNSKYAIMGSLYLDNIFKDINIIDSGEDFKVLKELEFEKYFVPLNNLNEFNKYMKKKNNFKGYSFNLISKVLKHGRNASKESIKVYSIILKVKGSDKEKLKNYYSLVNDYVRDKISNLFFNKLIDRVKDNFYQRKIDLESKIYKCENKIKNSKLYLKVLIDLKKRGKSPQKIAVSGDFSSVYLPIEQQITGRKIIIKTTELITKNYIKEKNEYEKAMSLLKKEPKELYKIKINISEYLNKIENEKIKHNLLELFELKQKLKDNLVFIKGNVEKQGKSLKIIIVLTFFVSLFIFIFLAFIIEWWENNKKNILKKNNIIKKL